MLVQYFKITILLLSTILLVGCSVKSPSVPSSDVDKLYRLILTTSNNIPPTEARRLSYDIFQKTAKLTEEFEIVSPPLWHNFLVNTGVRKKGLCYHWSDALFLHLKSQSYPSFEFHLVGANIGEYWSEHNAIVILPKGSKSIEDSIIIDPWRGSGKLYFSIVREDKKYKWSFRKDREYGVIK